MVRKLALVLVLGGAMAGTAGLSMNYAVAADAPTTQPREKHEKHPEIRLAIHHLEEAKKNLENGAHDFDGHRVAALKATETALEECRAALKADPN